MRHLLKGRKWGEFYSAPGAQLRITELGVDYLFRLRIGYFFNIPAYAIICGKKYVLLRKLARKHWRVLDQKKLFVTASDPFG